MPQSANPHFVGLDIGTSSVRCVVGMLDTAAGNKPSIIGHGSASNQGMRKGVVVHVDDVADAVVQAITEAERISGHRITQATVNVNGTHVSGINSKGVIAISGANREISQEDRYRVEEAATVVQLPPNREIIQFFAKNYSVDGQQNIKDPVGMSGVRLEVDAHIVTAGTPSLRNLDFALSKAQVAPQHHTVSSLAATEAVMSRQQKEAGTVLLDIGAGTTNLIVVEDGEVQHVAVLPIGGMHITNDLAIGLKTDLDVAEQVKLDHATLAKATKTTANVSVGKLTHSFSMDDVQMIVEARVEELFEFVDKELGRIKRSRKLPGGVILTGGTAKLPGIADFAKEQLQLSARIGKLNEEIGGLVDTVEGPAYAPVIGLMLLDMLLLPEAASAGQNTAHSTTASVFGMAEGLFKRLKR